ncbi:hypothetical protein [Antrihabitans cavernicola]|uniref:Polyketide cyclase n=1 Tax=Antrihabitans cavernicola TaxID=2495913 RepID=A0A5A7SEM1_9NOCA|nr:hypothetical protein [Spelaeibacter cavernicola]KAA0024044.1 hypothetical protein FOY51_05595 [Spelaeibacter cavernicola]
MTLIGTAQATSTAAPAAFFDRWADMSTWPEWNTDTEWVRLDGPFQQGATGKLKPKGGPAVRFVVERLVPEREFVDVSSLIGAKLTFSHHVTQPSSDQTAIDVEVTITGPLRWAWTKVMGADLAKSVQPDLDALVVAAERA